MPTICALARANQQDVARAAEAGKPAASPRIHTFIATSPLHMREKLRMQPQDVLERAVAAVKQARNETDDVYKIVMSFVYTCFLCYNGVKNCVVRACTCTRCCGLSISCCDDIQRM